MAYQIFSGTLLQEYSSIFSSPTLLYSTSFVLVLSISLFTHFFLPPKALTPPAGCRRLGLAGPSNLTDQYTNLPSDRPPSPSLLPYPAPTSTFRVKALFVYPIKSCAPLELSTSTVLRTGLAYDRHFSFAQLFPAAHASLPGKAAVGGAAVERKDEKEGEGERGRRWKFLTQRECPLLSQLVTSIYLPDPTLRNYSPDAEYVQMGGCVDVSFPTPPSPLLQPFHHLLRLLGHSTFTPIPTRTTTFRLPLHPTPARAAAKRYTRRRLLIWKDYPLALDVGGEIPPGVKRALADFLGVEGPLTLFRADEGGLREVYRCAPRKGEVGYQPVVGLADAYPLHLLGLSSARHLGASLPPSSAYHARLDARRFRANILVDGAPAFAEDAWARIAITPSPSSSPYQSASPSSPPSSPSPPSMRRKSKTGKRSNAEDGALADVENEKGGSDGDGEGGYSRRTLYHVSSRTARCALPNVDPATGARDHSHQPYSAMAAYRRIDAGAGVYPCLGMQVTPMFDGGLGGVRKGRGEGGGEEEEEGGVPGVISVGDEVRVLETTEEHFYIKQ